MNKIKEFLKHFWWIWLSFLIYVLIYLFLKFILKFSLQVIINFLAIATGSFASISLIFAGLQLKKQHEQQKENTRWQKAQVAHEFIKRFNDPAFREDLSKSITFLVDNKISNDEKYQIIEKNIELRSQIVLTLNFFEEMGIMYNKNFIDKELIKDFFKSISIDFYTNANFFIQKRRSLNPDHAKNFTQWQSMNKEL